MIFRGLKDRSLKAWRQTAAISISTAYVLSLTLAVGGYLIFLDQSLGNVLNNFPDSGEYLEY